MPYLHNPQKFMWLFVPVLLVLSVAGLRKAIDLQLHDTYLVIGLPHFGVLLSLLLVLAGGGYWLVGQQDLEPWLTATHVVLTVLACITILVTGLLYQSGAKQDFRSFQTVNRAVLWLLLVAAGSQLLFVTNVVWTFLRVRGLG